MDIKDYKTGLDDSFPNYRKSFTLSNQKRWTGFKVTASNSMHEFWVFGIWQVCNCCDSLTQQGINLAGSEARNTFPLREYLTCAVEAECKDSQDKLTTDSLEDGKVLTSQHQVETFPFTAYCEGDEGTCEGLSWRPNWLCRWGTRVYQVRERDTPLGLRPNRSVSHDKRKDRRDAWIPDVPQMPR